MRQPTTTRPKATEWLAVYRTSRGWIVAEGFAGHRMGEALAGPFRTMQEALAERDAQVAAIVAARRAGPRACLCCGATFASRGPFHRLCPVCSGRAGSLPAQMAG